MDTAPPINTRLVQALGDLASQVTWEHAVAAGLAISSVFLWLHGGRLVKTLFLLVAGVSGAMLGGTAAVGLGLPPLAGASPALVGAVAGGALGVVFSIVLFRMAMAGCAAITLAAAASLLSLEVLAPRSALSRDPASPPERITITSRDMPSRPARSTAAAPSKGSPDNVPDIGLPSLDPSSIDFETLARALRESAPESNQLRDALLRKALGGEPASADFGRSDGGHVIAALPSVDQGLRRLQQTHADTAARIAGLDPGRKLWFAGLGASGLVFGFLFGLVMPKTAAAAISAALGALGIVVGGVWLVELFNPSWIAELDQPVWIYTAIIAALWVIGFRSQIKRPRPDKKPSKDTTTA